MPCMPSNITIMGCLSLCESVSEWACFQNVKFGILSKMPVFKTTIIDVSLDVPAI